MYDVYDALSPLDDAAWWDPDGLTAGAIDALIDDAVLDGELDALSTPLATTALLDGTARARRDRRIAQRTLGNTARVINVHTDLTAMPVQAGTEAA